VQELYSAFIVDKVDKYSAKAIKHLTEIR